MFPVTNNHPVEKGYVDQRQMYLIYIVFYQFGLSVLFLVTW
jgi:hypothetical protein